MIYHSAEAVICESITPREAFYAVTYESSDPLRTLSRSIINNMPLSSEMMTPAEFYLWVRIRVFYRSSRVLVVVNFNSGETYVLYPSTYDATLLENLEHDLEPCGSKLWR